MGKFLLGVMVTLVVLVAGSYGYFELGYVDLRADIKPSEFESKYAMRAVDASSERHAPHSESPLRINEAELAIGAKLYRANCALCHGAPSEPESKLGRFFYPPAPQFMKEPPTDMTVNQDFYITKHGIRWTAMPAWEGSMSDDEIWKVSAFLRNMTQLPPAVDQEWRKPAP